MSSLECAGGSRNDAISLFANVAERYCSLIDARSELTADSLLQQAHEMLPTLYSAALALPDRDVDDCHEGEATDDMEDGDAEEPPPENIPQADPDRITHDQWQILFDSLRNMIGPRDGYWHIFDPYADPPEPPCFTSLSDDFADIYQELMYGLKAFRRGMPDQAAWRWRLHFNGHWAAHAASALRAIEALASMHDLGFPRQRHPA